jgi:hypothetical protein
MQREVLRIHSFKDPNFRSRSEDKLNHSTGIEPIRQESAELHRVPGNIYL